MLTTVLIVASVSLLAQAQSGKAGPTNATVKHRSQAAAVSLEFKRVREFRLGAVDSVAPASVHDAVLSGSTVWVLDGNARRLLAYAIENGARLLAVGKAGSEPGEFEVPRRLAVRGETLYVMDVTHRNTISAFDTKGRYLGARASSLGGVGATSLLVQDSMFVVATLTPHAASPNKRRSHLQSVTRGVVMFAGAGGEVHDVACIEDPGYETSRKLGGVLRGYAFRDVSAFRNVFLCAQPISPDIQVVTRSGDVIATIKAVPSFYLPPVDSRSTKEESPADILDFQSKWTVHDRVFATSRGFFSVYSRYDRTQSTPVYTAFACDLDERFHPRACRSGRVPGKPLRLLQPDTLMVLVRSSDRSGLPMIRLYHFK